MASPQPRVGVVTYPGSQDDRDALWALSALDAEAVPVWHEERELPLVVERADLPFTSRCSVGRRIVIPVKHGDGRWFAPPDLVRELEANRQVVFRYAEPCNGSVDDIAGVCNERGNVLGLMPHPEHAVDPLLGSADGALILASLVEAARERVLAAILRLSKP